MFSLDLIGCAWSYCSILYNVCLMSLGGLLFFEGIQREVLEEMLGGKKRLGGLERGETMIRCNI